MSVPFMVDHATEPAFGSQMRGGPFILNTHAPDSCAGESCAVHAPTDHHMRTWPTNWRADRGLLERLCPHGVGHPDPDSAAFHAREGREYESGHGCDGCCVVPA